MKWVSFTIQNIKLIESIAIQDNLSDDTASNHPDMPNIHSALLVIKTLVSKERFLDH